MSRDGEDSRRRPGANPRPEPSTHWLLALVSEHPYTAAGVALGVVAIGAVVLYLYVDNKNVRLDCGKGTVRAELPEGASGGSIFNNRDNVFKGPVAQTQVGPSAKASIVVGSKSS